MNRAERRRERRQRGLPTAMSTVCVRSDHVDGLLRITYARHAGDVRHSDAACLAERQELVELWPSHGVCDVCERDGQVFNVNADDPTEPPVCERCAVRVSFAFLTDAVGVESTKG